MRITAIIILLWFGMVVSYAAWKGNNTALPVTEYFNSKGEKVYPVVAKNMEQAAAIGNAQYYTGADGTFGTDIYIQNSSVFNWEVFFQALTFGCGLAFLLLVVYRLSTRLAKEKP